MPTPCVAGRRILRRALGSKDTDRGFRSLLRHRTQLEERAKDIVRPTELPPYMQANALGLPSVQSKRTDWRFNQMFRLRVRSASVTPLPKNRSGTAFLLQYTSRRLEHIERISGVVGCEPGPWGFMMFA